LLFLANYSQHYFGSPILHPDYFGVFSDKIAARIEAGEGFVAMMSQGTSGDQMWMDYGKPKSDITLDQYAEGVTTRAMEGVSKDSVPRQVDPGDGGNAANLGPPRARFATVGVGQRLTCEDERGQAPQPAGSVCARASVSSR
jgi:hypothetical protein